MKSKDFQGNERFFDLNWDSRRSHTFAVPRKEVADESRQNALCPVDGFSPGLRIPQMRRAVSWTLQGPKFFLLGSFSLLGLRPTDLPGKPARHRSLSAVGAAEALSFGYPGTSIPQYFGQRQRRAGLADLRRLCPGVDLPSPSALCPRGLRPGVGSNRLRSRFHYHRSVPGALSLGQVPQTQRSGETAYPARSSRLNPDGGMDYHGQILRCQHPRRIVHRNWSDLHHGSRLSRLRPSAPDPFGLSLLCDSRQKEPLLSATILGTGGQDLRAVVRPNHSPERLLRPPRLPRQTATHRLLRNRKQPTSGLSDQQLHPASLDHCQALQMPLAGGTVLQMDQTAFADQGLLWYIRERSEDSNLDRHIGLCAGSDHQKATSSGLEPLHNPTDFERNPFRKNSNITGTYINRLHR